MNMPFDRGLSMMLPIILLFGLCTTALCSHLRTEKDYLYIIGDKIEFHECSLRVISSAVEAVLSDPEIWTKNLLVSERESFETHGKIAHFAKYYGRYDICKECQNRHPKSKVLKVLCQFNQWLDELKDPNKPFSSVSIYMAQLAVPAAVEESASENEANLTEPKVVADLTEPKVETVTSVPGNAPKVPEYDLVIHLPDSDDDSAFYTVEPKQASPIRQDLKRKLEGTDFEVDNSSNKRWKIERTDTEASDSLPTVGAKVNGESS